MFQEICSDPSTPRRHGTGSTGLLGNGCRAFSLLQAWQIKRYRRAVEENKWYLSEKTGRDVGWEEAELDFLVNGYYGCAPKWRVEYCSSKCNHFTGCTLGQNFCSED